MGAHSVMLAPPALPRPNEAAVLAHYLAVADAIDLPVVVQDHPASSGVYMSVDLLAAIAERAPIVPRRQARGRAESAEGRTPARAADPASRVLGGLGAIMLLEELRRGGRRDDDRLRVPRAPRGDRRAVPGR